MSYEVTPLDEVATPFLLIDGETVRRNIARMAEYARQHQIAWRPHTKTHKSRFIAQLQLDAGAQGLTTAKVGEAEVLSGVTRDLLIAYPTVDWARTRHVARLALETEVKVALDTPYAVQAVSRAATQAGSEVGVLIDLDVGFGRTGTRDIAAAVALAELVDQMSGVVLQGLFIYPGHVHGTLAEQRVAMREITSLVQNCLEAFDQKGLCRDYVSGGSSPTAYSSHLIQGLNEFRPGTNVFHDMNLCSRGYCEMSDCAARIVTTVVSDTVADQVILDAGSKTLTSDLRNGDPEAGYGALVEYPEAKIYKLTEEHAQVNVTQCDERPRVGDTVSVIPNHICVCVNMQNSMWWREHPEDEDVTRLPVDCRGLLS